MDNIKRIGLWSGPRNISTALMYSFAQRKDTRVYDEPLYAHYLTHSVAQSYHPGAKDVLSTMENNGDKVVDMMMGPHDRPVVFFKNMTHHLLDLNRSFMTSIVNVILTRDPLEMLPSFAKVIRNPTMDDVGYAMHTQLIEYFEEKGITYLVLDSKKVLLNPEKVLKEFCERVDIPFDQNMLKWEAGARPEDGVWAKYWYENVHASVGFQKYHAKIEPFPEELNSLLEECQKHYSSLAKLAIG